MGLVEVGEEEMKECPLSKGGYGRGGIHKRPCPREECAWWLEDAKECVVVGIVYVLGSIESELGRR